MAEGALLSEQREFLWGDNLILTGLIVSMVVNVMVTGLIVFKVLMVFLEIKATVTSIERTLGTLSTTGGPKLRHIIFIIIESGMALSAIQLVRVVISSLIKLQAMPTPRSFQIALDFVIAIHEMLNVIIKSVFYLFYYYTDNIYLARALHQQ